MIFVKPQPMQKRPVDVVVLSDLHLGTYGCHAREIGNYLRSITPQILILNGDIIDGWQFRKRYFPPDHLQVIREILNLLNSGTRVIYITGNHDEMLRRYSDTQLGNFQLCDKLVMEINGKMAWIFHGDVFDNTTKGSARLIAKLGGYGYDWLILLNRGINWCLTKIGRPKMSLSKRIKNSVKRAVAWINKFEQTAAELAIQKKYDFVICGHIHQPVAKTITTRNGSVTYLNSGDWVENLTSLEYSNNEWSVYHYDPVAFRHAHVVNMHKSTPPLSVISDEVGLLISTLQL